MTGPRRLTNREVAKIRRRRRTETLASIAKDYGVSLGTVRYWTSDVPTTAGRGGLPARSTEDVAEIRRRRRTGETLASIGDDYGLSRERIRQLTVGIRVPRKNGGPCSVDGCGKPAESRRMCRTHYARWRMRGTTDDPARISCPRCGHRWAQNSANRCPGCGISRYHAFPLVRVGPKAQALATNRLVWLHKDEYDRYYALPGTLGVRQRRARQLLVRAHRPEYQALYQEEAVALRKSIAETTEEKAS